MSFSDNIKKWVSIDDEIRALNLELKNKRLERSNILESIIQYKTDNNLDGKMIKYNQQTLKFSKTRQYQSITYEFIKTCLNDLIDDKGQVQEILEYIKEKRSFKNVEDIKRFYT
jgi:hypothetical protein